MNNNELRCPSCNAKMDKSSVSGYYVCAGNERHYWRNINAGYRLGVVTGREKKLLRIIETQWDEMMNIITDNANKDREIQALSQKLQELGEDPDAIIEEYLHFVSQEINAKHEEW